jgi:hypothetical protein
VAACFQALGILIHAKPPVQQGLKAVTLVRRQGVRECINIAGYQPHRPEVLLGARRFDRAPNLIRERPQVFRFVHKLKAQEYAVAK